MSNRSPMRSLQKSLAKSVESHLNVYSASALVAGVSLLALAQPAEGEVVVTHVNVPLCGATVDLNKDGKPDFSFPCYGSFYEHTFYMKLMVAPLTGGKAVGGARKSAGPYASALGSGAKIGPSAHFSSSVGIEQLLVERSGGGQSGGSTTSGYSLVGQWGNKGPRYLGVKFLINGQTHYGWIRMSVARHNHHAQSMYGTITEFAYETVANKAITAGATKDASASAAKSDPSPTKPGVSLGALALGAQGIPIWRRENTPSMAGFVQLASNEGGRL